MEFRRIVVFVLVLAFLFIALNTPVTAQTSGADQKKTMWCNTPNTQLYQLCQDPELMKGLTPQQKKELDEEWQRRVPTMTPEDRKLYYPEGQRYYPGG